MDFITHLFYSELLTFLNTTKNALTQCCHKDQQEVISEWHINADAPGALDYKLKKANQLSELYNADAYRTSDDKPVVIEFILVQ
ncbi:MAG: hypothetical protein ACN4GM_02240 [Gammaproteobacteria bacterium]